MSIEQAVAALRRGEIVGVPTDTLYGLAADPFREDALNAIFELKGRPSSKPMAILVSSLAPGMTLASPSLSCCRVCHPLPAGSAMPADARLVSAVPTIRWRSSCSKNTDRLL